MDHVDEIVKMVFQYIDLLKENKTQEWIFNEITQLRNLMFDFKDKENPLGFVTGLSGQLFFVKWLLHLLSFCFKTLFREMTSVCFLQARCTTFRSKTS